MSGPVVIRLVHKTGITHAGSHHVPPGDFLERWDLEFRGVGAAWWTPDLAKAHRFADAAEAMTVYRSQSRTRPIRQDGRPNRPLTAYTVEVVPLSHLERNS